MTSLNDTSNNAIDLTNVGMKSSIPMIRSNPSNVVTLYSQSLSNGLFQSRNYSQPTNDYNIGTRGVGSQVFPYSTQDSALQHNSRNVKRKTLKSHI